MNDTKEMTMCGMDKEIFLATRTLTSLIGQACRWWSFLSDELASLDKAAQDALEKYQKDYPKQVAELIERQNIGLQAFKECVNSLTKNGLGRETP